MADVRAHECFVEDQRRLLETFFDVAELPFGIGERGHRQPALPVFLCLGIVPLHVDRLGNARRLTLGGRLGAFPDVAFDARILRTRHQRRHGIHVERQRLPLDLDAFDRVGSDRLTDGAHGEHRLTLIHRLVGERRFAARIGPDHRAVVVDLIFGPGHIVRPSEWPSRRAWPARRSRRCS